ncbi:MAG: hypothetical protein KKA54_12965 [Proteobacteria bacterium]|nr:hypothetical protein [Pseudomonadota bacterium]
MAENVRKQLCRQRFSANRDEGDDMTEGIFFTKREVDSRKRSPNEVIPKKCPAC